VLTLPKETNGRTGFYLVKLTSGSANTTTPNVLYSYVEITTPWIWEFTVDCTSNRNDLTGQGVLDGQGLKASDLYWLLHNAWENAMQVTIFHPNGQTYYAAIDSLEVTSTSPTARIGVPGQYADFESHVKLVLKQELPVATTL